MASEVVVDPPLTYQYGPQAVTHSGNRASCMPITRRRLMDPRILPNLGLSPSNYSGQSTSGILMDVCEAELAGGAVVNQINDNDVSTLKASL